MPSQPPNRSDGGFTWENTYRQNWSRAECSRRYILWDERCKIGWLLKLEYPESNRSNFKANSVANRKPMQIRKNRRDVAEPRFLCDHSNKSILDMLKASEIWNACASQERVAIIKSRANYCYSYGFRSLSSKRRMWRSARIYFTPYSRMQTISVAALHELHTAFFTLCTLMYSFVAMTSDNLAMSTFARFLQNRTWSAGWT